MDRGHAGEQPAEQAEVHGIHLDVVKHPGSKKGFVLLPRRSIIVRSFGWTTRSRRLVKDYERLRETVAGLHFVASACLMLACTVLAFGRVHNEL